jgi:hypothetical protein
MSPTVSLVAYHTPSAPCPKCRPKSDPVWIDCAAGCCIID